MASSNPTPIYTSLTDVTRPCGAAFAVTTFLFSLARGPRAGGADAGTSDIMFVSPYQIVCVIQSVQTQVSAVRVEQTSALEHRVAAGTPYGEFRH